MTTPPFSVQVLINAFNASWPGLCTSTQFTLGDGVSTLDPITFNNSANANLGKQCVYGFCTEFKVSLRTLTGISSFQIGASSFQMFQCNTDFLCAVTLPLSSALGISANFDIKLPIGGAVNYDMSLLLDDSNKAVITLLVPVIPNRVFGVIVSYTFQFDACALSTSLSIGFVRDIVGVPTELNDFKSFILDALNKAIVECNTSLIKTLGPIISPLLEPVFRGLGQQTYLFTNPVTQECWNSFVLPSLTPPVLADYDFHYTPATSGNAWTVSNIQQSVNTKEDTSSNVVLVLLLFFCAFIAINVVLNSVS